MTTIKGILEEKETFRDNTISEELTANDIWKSLLRLQLTLNKVLQDTKQYLLITVKVFYLKNLKQHLIVQFYN